MITKFKYETNNIVYLPNEYDRNGKRKIDKKRSSHMLELKTFKGLDRYITFDTESDSIFYYRKKLVTRELYNKYPEEDKDKKRLFKLRMIQACFCNKTRRVRKVYIEGPSVYTNKKIKFSYINQLNGSFNMITANIVYSDNIINDFINDIIDFCSKGDPDRWQSTKIFCHNAKHDWLQTAMFLWHKKFNLKLGEFNLTTPRFAIWEITNNCRMEFIDTTNYFKQKLKSMGEDIGIIKQEDKTDWNHDLVIDRSFIEYGIIDTEILAQRMWIYAEMVAQYGKLGYGVPSTAYNIWITSFLEHNIWLHKNRDLMAIERRAYFGGRTEVFKLGFYTNIFGIDINSSYPYQMEKELPIQYDFSLLGTNENISIAKYKLLAQKYCMIIEAIVTSNLEIPVIPYRHNGKLLFINGNNLEVTLCQPEIDLLLDLNCQVQIKKIHCYKKAFAMKKFSKFFMQMKVAGKNEKNKAKADFGKLNANSSYGKLAERLLESEIFPCDPDLIGNINIQIPYAKVEGYSQKVKTEHIMFKHLCGKMVRNTKTNEDAENAFCAMGAFITSYARVDLYRAMLKIKKENIIYCDTDSVYFINNNNLIGKVNIDFDKTKIGAWDIEEENINMLVFGCKDYYKFTPEMQKLKQKLKGVALHSAIEIDQNTYVIKQWQGFHYAFKNNELESQTITNIEKTLNRQYEKAMVLTPDNTMSLQYIDEDESNKKLEFIQSEILHFNFNIDEIK